MRRDIALFALLQIVFVVLGWCGLAVVMKFAGYPNTGFGIRWSPVAVNLREYGWLLLFVPLVWTILALIAVSYEHRVILNAAVAIFGALFMAGVLIGFRSAALVPYKRSMFISLDPPNSQSESTPLEPAANER